MRVKIFATLCLAAVASMLSVVTLSAQTKLAVVDFQTALLATADMQAEAGKLEAEFKPKQDELARVTEEMQSLQQRLVAATDAQQQAELQSQGAMAQRRYERLRDDLQASIDFRRDGILQRGAGRMNAVLEKLRVEKSIDAIIDSTSAYAFNPSLDITVEATAAYNAAHPASAN